LPVAGARKTTFAPAFSVGMMPFDHPVLSVPLFFQSMAVCVVSMSRRRAAAVGRDSAAAGSLFPAGIPFPLSQI
jgi:hypothetical protein